MKRTKLADRVMPGYSRNEELSHMISHIVGAALGLVALIWCLILADGPVEIATSVIYGTTMILLYTASSIYHGLTHPMAKRVFQILDHCAIYLYIAGCYTIIALCAVRSENAAMAWALFGIEWGTAAVAVTLTAIDIKMFRHFSLTCYLVMGWAVLFAVKPTFEALGATGFALLLTGGLLYTIGAIFYGAGKKLPYAHLVFHIFTLLGSFFQFLCIAFYVL
ncbi:MAG: hemolysin III family protein [Actinobacteria bacterium]|nr:hemolysin III family protein [Actinomycetota bacterium]